MSEPKYPPLTSADHARLAAELEQAKAKLRCALKDTGFVIQQLRERVLELEGKPPPREEASE